MKNAFIKDILAGLTVSFAALSLGAAFGTMSGRGAFAGMIGAAVIAIITSLLGGTRIQASGPTGPMTAVTAMVVAKAYDIFPDKVLAEQFITLILLMSGALMVVAGLLQLGKLIRWVPNAVVLGFMNGIAVLIWYDQLAKIFGLSGKSPLEGGAWLNVALAVVTLTLIFTLPVLLKKIGVSAYYRPFFSAILISIIAMTALSNVAGWPLAHVALGATVGDLGAYGKMISDYFPSSQIFTTEYLLKALPYALQLTLLGYLDSLLTALIIDRMTKEQTLQNKELVAQGVANFTSGLLQGIPGAQATIRSVLLVKEQAQTRFAGVAMGLFVLISLLAFKDYISLIPAAVFAGVLIKAGWDVFDREYTQMYFANRWIRSFNRNLQMLLILYTTAVTVIFDLNIAVLTGSLIFYLLRYIFKYKFKDVEPELEDEID